LTKIICIKKKEKRRDTKVKALLSPEKRGENLREEDSTYALEREKRSRGGHDPFILEGGREGWLITIEEKEKNKKKRGGLWWYLWSKGR